MRQKVTFEKEVAQPYVTHKNIFVWDAIRFKIYLYIYL